MEPIDTESAEVSPENEELARRIYAHMGTEASLLEKVRGRVLARSCGRELDEGRVLQILARDL